MHPPNWNKASGHLEKKFSKLTMIGLSFAIINTWIALAGTLGYVLMSGGSVAFVYGFILCAIANLCIAASLGELTSIWPTAGGQYHWAFALATERWKKLMSFFCGWLTIAAWLTAITTQSYFGSLFINAAVVMGSEGAYQVAQWKTYLIFMALSHIAICLNIFGFRILGKWNEGALYWSVGLCLVTAVVLLATSEKNTAKFVFTDFQNMTGYPDGVAWLLGLLQSALSFAGYDAVAHMVEEMPRPTRDAPNAMILSVTIGGVTGLAYILVILFCITDLDTVLATPTGMPIVEMIYKGTGSRAGATFLAVAFSGCFINGANGSVTSGSRLLWAMARDNGSPFSKYLSHVDQRWNVPVRAIVTVYICGLIFGLLSLGPSVAFNAYMSSVTIIYNCSYAAPIIILLFRGRSLIAKEKRDFRLGHWCGYIINYAAVIFVAVTSVFFCFPIAIPVNADNMNYVTGVIAIFLIFVTGLWLVKRKDYEGPQFDLILDESVLIAQDSHVSEPEDIQSVVDTNKVRQDEQAVV